MQEKEKQDFPATLAFHPEDKVVETCQARPSSIPSDAPPSSSSHPGLRKDHRKSFSVFSIRTRMYLLQTFAKFLKTFLLSAGRV